MKTIEESTRILHLPYIREHYKDEAEHAVLSDMDHEAFLEGLLDAETIQREQNALRNRIRRARFPYHMDSSLFQTGHLDSEVARRIRLLENLDFIQNKENIILAGSLYLFRHESLPERTICSFFKRSGLFNRDSRSYVAEPDQPLEETVLPV